MDATVEPEPEPEMDPEQCTQVEQIPLPAAFRTAGGHPPTAFAVRQLLSATECAAWVRASEERGFEVASVQVGGNSSCGCVTFAWVP